MEIPISEELVDICKSIVSEGRSTEEWVEVESDDMFQQGKFVGGFDATEGEFCFSYYDDKGYEYWFQMSVETVQRVADGRVVKLAGRPAE